MNSNILSFYIDEGNRSKIDNLEFVFEDNTLTSLDKKIIELENKLKKEGFTTIKI